MVHAFMELPWVYYCISKLFTFHLIVDAQQALRTNVLFIIKQENINKRAFLFNSLHFNNFLFINSEKDTNRYFLPPCSLPITTCPGELRRVRN